MPAFERSFVEKHIGPAYSLTEVLFGLIMVLTVTLGAGVATGAEEGSAGTLLLAALGCNLAWGLIDGVMYVMDAMFNRGRAARIRSELNLAGERGALAIIARELNPRLADITTTEERARLYRAVLTLAARRPVTRTRLERGDIYGGIACVLLVFFTALPAAVPFVLVDDTRLALRVSNGLLVAMLFGVGYFWAGYTTASRVGAGLAMTFIGLILVGTAIALGG